MRYCGWGFRNICREMALPVAKPFQQATSAEMIGTNGLEANVYLDVTTYLREETKNCANVKRMWFIKT